MATLKWGASERLLIATSTIRELTGSLQAAMSIKDSNLTANEQDGIESAIDLLMQAKETIQDVLLGTYSPDTECDE